MDKKDLIKASLYEDLPYRKFLNIAESFGLEIEMSLEKEEDISYIVPGKLEKQDFKIKYDETILKNIPLEIVTPVLHNSALEWTKLYELGERMQQCEMSFDRATFQVNLDVSYSYYNFYCLLLFFRTFEHIIFRFSLSNQEYLRPLSYARSLRNFFLYYDVIEKNKYALRRLFKNKNYALAVKNYRTKNPDSLPNIVEYRSPNGCNDAWLWQNYVNTFAHLNAAIPSLDLEFIDFKLCLDNQRGKNYIAIDIADALKFADIIFTEDIDKIYFLRQYFGRDIEEVKKLVLGGEVCI